MNKIQALRLNDPSARNIVSSVEMFEDNHGKDVKMQFSISSGGWSTSLSSDKAIRYLILQSDINPGKIIDIRVAKSADPMISMSDLKLALDWLEDLAVFWRVTPTFKITKGLLMDALGDGSITPDQVNMVLLDDRILATERVVREFFADQKWKTMSPQQLSDDLSDRFVHHSLTTVMNAMNHLKDTLEDVLA